MSWGARGLEDFEAPAAFSRKARGNAERQRQHSARRVADGRAPNDGDTKRLQNTARDVPRRFVAGRRVALRELAENDSGETAQCAGLHQVHQDAIHLIGLHEEVLENENCAAGIELPGSAEGRLDKREAAAKENTLGRAREERFSMEVERPATLGFREGAGEAFGVVAMGRARAAVKIRGDHGAIERDAMEFLPEKNFERGDVARAEKDFGRFGRRAQAVEKVIRAVAASGAKDGTGSRVGERFAERGGTIRGGAGEK